MSRLHYNLYFDFRVSLVLFYVIKRLKNDIGQTSTKKKDYFIYFSLPNVYNHSTITVINNENAHSYFPDNRADYSNCILSSYQRKRSLIDEESPCIKIVVGKKNINLNKMIYCHPFLQDEVKISELFLPKTSFEDSQKKSIIS